MIASGYDLIFDSFQANKTLIINGLGRSLLKLSIVWVWAVHGDRSFGHICEAKTVDAGDANEKEGEEERQYDEN